MSGSPESSEPLPLSFALKKAIVFTTIASVLENTPCHLREQELTRMLGVLLDSMSLEVVHELHRDLLAYKASEIERGIAEANLPFPIRSALASIERHLAQMN